MRPEVGFADLVRAIDRLSVRRQDDAHAISDLIAPGIVSTAARRFRPPPGDDLARRRDPVSAVPSRPDPPRSPRTPRAQDADPDSSVRDDDASSVRELPARERGSADAARAVPISQEGDGSPVIVGPLADAEPLRLDPMIEPGLARAIIAALVGRPVFEGPIDLATAISVLASGRPLRRVPRRRRRTLRFAAQLLIDAGAGMMPYAGDVADLERHVKGVVGAERVDVVSFVGAAAPIVHGDDPDDAARIIQRGGEWRIYECPAPMTPVLVLTDFGLAHGGLTSRETATWRQLAMMLARTDSPLIVLTPCPPQWWPRALDGAVTIVQWDRATARVRRASFEPFCGEATAPRPTRERRRIDHALDALVVRDQDFGWFAAAHPSAYALARLVALTARCEPALVRRLRRRFLPAEQAWVEGELWASPLVEVRSVSGLRLRADVTRALLDTWRGDPQLPEVATVVESAHLGASFVVRLQERLTARAMQSDAQGRWEAQRILARVAATVALSDGKPNPLQSWAQYALGRLPSTRLAEDPAAFHLALAASPSGPALIGSGVRDAALLRAPDVESPLAAGIAYDVASQAHLGERRRGVRVRRQRAAAVFELAERAPSGGIELSVPDTRPLILEVYSGENAPVMITLDAGEVRVPWVDGPLVIYAIDGKGWQLRPVTARRAPIEAPWSSLARLVGSREPAFGYLADKRTIVVAAASVDPAAIGPVEVAVGDVMLSASLAVVDEDHGVALLKLQGDAPVEPFEVALRDASETTGTFAVSLRPGSPRVVPVSLGAARDPAGPGRTSDGNLGSRPISFSTGFSTGSSRGNMRDVAHPGTVIVSDGRVVGMLTARRAGVPDREQRWNVAPLGAIEQVRVQQRADEAAIVELGQWIEADPEANWPGLQAAAGAVLPGLRLAHGYMDSLAHGGGALRGAAVWWWTYHPSRHAVPHALAVLVQSTRGIERRIAIGALERLVADHLVEAGDARPARRMLGTLARQALDNELAGRVRTLRDRLASIEGPREKSNLGAVTVPHCFDRRGTHRLVAALRGELRVLVLSGGIDGASRLGIAHTLHRSCSADLAIAWSFHGPADVGELVRGAGELLTLPAEARLADLARAAAEADACVLLDHFDRIAGSREEALRSLQGFVDVFLHFGRGRCIVTWSGSVPQLASHAALECIALPSLPLVVQFREHLLTTPESPRLLGKWLSELVGWGPVAAVAAVVRVVTETLPRAVPDTVQPFLAEYLSALRAWLDEPGGAQTEAFAALAARQPAALDGPPLRLNRITEVLTALLRRTDRFMKSRDAGPDPAARDGRLSAPAIEVAFGREMVAIAPLLSHATLQTLQAIIRRAYMGTSYRRDDATELVFAFEGAVESRAREIERVLRALTAGDVEPAAGHNDTDKLTFRATPSVFRQLQGRWQSGALTELGGVRVRWLAELSPFPIQDDPQKGHWGGLPERNGRIATATVTRVDDTSEWFNIHVEIEARPGAPALRGPVRAHLHDSFAEPVVDVPLRRGRAVLTLLAWGSFTIGIECDRGTTHLEIDLANVPDVDPEFLDDDPAIEPGLEVASYGIDVPLELGTTWTYTTERRTTHQMRVVEHVTHPDGVVAVKIEGLIVAPPAAIPGLWLLTRGDGRYYAIADDPRSAMVRLRSRTDDLRDVMVTENLFLRLRARPRSSFANASCIVSVVDVRFTTVSGRGYHRDAVVYDVVQAWPMGSVKLSIAPGVGVISATDLQGNTWLLTELSMAKPAAAGKPATRPRIKPARKHAPGEGKATRKKPASRKKPSSRAARRKSRK